MAKHSFERTRNHQATRLLLLPALVLGLGLATSWAGQQAPVKSQPAPKPAPTTVPANGQDLPAKLAKTLAQRKRANSHTSALADGKRDPFKLPLEHAGNKANAASVLDSTPGGVTGR